jgi:hypothetical protein
LTNAVYVTCRKLLKIVKLANFSGEAIFPTLFQVLTIQLKNDPWKVDVHSGCLISPLSGSTLPLMSKIV